PENAHVIPSLLLKVHRAKREGSPYVDLWGTGKPFREFLHSHDLARALCLLLELSEIEYSGLLSDVPLINVGHGSDISIRALAETIAEVVGYEGELRFDATKPDGTPRKLLDSSRIFSLGWKPQISLREGLKETYNGVLGTLDSFVSSRVG
ncbi:MAG: NAD-dependent epimerase/dehydratase family protein, partial [Chlamydiia bacterium]|nr:NAD-dependent epimerase/dehydratase family protein [Chlamydiia bacterium]